MRYPLDAAGLAEWEDKSLQEIFQFTLVPTEKQGAGPRYLYLHQIADESNGCPPFSLVSHLLSNGDLLFYRASRLSRDLLDAAIIERINIPFSSHLNPFSYLLGAFQRAQVLLEGLHVQDKVCDWIEGFDLRLDFCTQSLAPKQDIMRSVSDTCITYSGLVLSGALVEDDQEVVRQNFIRLLEVDPALSKTLPKVIAAFFRDCYCAHLLLLWWCLFVFSFFFSFDTCRRKHSTTHSGLPLASGGPLRI